MERKRIPSYLNHYADRSGYIWRKDNNGWVKINPVLHAVGYQYTTICGKKHLTQRLVCSAFKGECVAEYPLCIRKAKMQQPRRVRSQRYLNWGTHDNKRIKGGYKHLTLRQQLKILELNKKGITQVTLSERFGVTQPTISYLINGRTKLRKR